MQGRILGIDYGEARVGIAVTDPLQITAQGLETIHYQKNEKMLFQRLREIIKEYQIKTAVIGIPISMNGEQKEKAILVKMFAKKMQMMYNDLRIEEVDERLTTVQAHKTMNLLNVNKKKKKNLVDTISAVYILETYLNKKERML